MKELLKRLAGKKLLSFYHYLKASAAAFLYGYPSEQMLVVGVTGTKGKSTTANFLWAGLTGVGLKTGMIGTANIKIGSSEFLNTYRMTMPSPFVIQRTLRKMFNMGCQAVVVETTSQGIMQFREKGINYDILIFTNLTPEHIESHGSFENYRAAKQKIFKNLNASPRKALKNLGKIPKVIIVNADSPEAQNFLKFPADKKLTYGFKNDVNVRATDVKENRDGVHFNWNGRGIDLKTLGAFNVYNVLPVLAVGEILNFDLDRLIKGIEGLSIVPGRMEILEREPFYVIIDYAHEPASMRQALTAVRKIISSGRRIVVLMGAMGGDRDKQKRPTLGSIGAQLADYVVISNEDPVDEDPMKIISEIASGALKKGKIDGENLFRIKDRREGIIKCLKLARPGDAVIITGKGSEQSILVGSKRIPWDDRAVTRQELTKLAVYKK